MAEAKGMYIPYHWVDEIAINDEGKVDIEYSREVAWELLKALKAQGTGEQIDWPQDRYLKAIIRGYLQQERTMQSGMQIFTNNKKGNLSDKELEDLLYRFRLEGKQGPEIVKILNNQYGCSYKDHSFIYRNKGWKNAKPLKETDQLNSAESDGSAENEENSVKYDF